MRFSKTAIQVLIRHSWPGNVGELQNIIKTIVAICKQETVQADMVFQLTREYELTEPFTINAAVSRTEKIRQALITALVRKTEAAKIPCISRSTLSRIMRSLWLNLTH
jgi:transcriptional regulator of acetoin/glycerol metabolism